MNADNIQSHKRWYDSHYEAITTLELLKNLDGATKKQVSQDLIKIVQQIKELHEEQPEPDLSIGLERVLGLYKASSARRWYDKSTDLNNAIRAMSTLPEDDFFNIMEGLAVSLS